MSDAAYDEVALKAAFWNSETVNARLAEMFADCLAEAALLVSTLVGEDPADPECSDEASCRLMLAALKVSDGDLVKLRLWVAAARMDPRDLLAAAEYRRELQGGGDAEREADLAEYLDWASGAAHGGV